MFAEPGLTVQVEKREVQWLRRLSGAPVGAMSGDRMAGQRAYSVLRACA